MTGGASQLVRHNASSVGSTTIFPSRSRQSCGIAHRVDSSGTPEASAIPTKMMVPAIYQRDHQAVRGTSRVVFWARAVRFLAPTIVQCNWDTKWYHPPPQSRGGRRYERLLFLVNVFPLMLTFKTAGPVLWTSQSKILSVFVSKTKPQYGKG